MKALFVLAFLITLLILVPIFLIKAGVPVAVYGYIYMPDGSPAAGASVSVSGGGDSKHTSAGGSGGYSVTLNVDKVPTSVSVSASKEGCSASTSRSGVEGSVRIDLVLRCPSQPSTPSTPSAPHSAPSKSYPSGEQKKNETSQLKAEASDVITFMRIFIQRKLYHVNDTIVVNGSISPPFKTTIELVFMSPSRKEISVRVQTDEKGIFSYKFGTNETGDWSVYARFPGAKGYLASVTDILSFSVKDFARIYSNLSLKGKEISVWGNIYPIDPDLRVQILISLDNESWAVIRELPVSNGSFSFNMRTGICGTFKLKTATTGTKNLERSEGSEIIVKIPCTEGREKTNATNVNIIANLTPTNLSSGSVPAFSLTSVLISFILGFIIAVLIFRVRIAIR